ncbi:MAG: stage III sporulation protein AF [Defluviitaleaceae bacterium]|nr:stage III sporulation protein AF [Defluviitaleaceae bacterium]
MSAFFDYLRNITYFLLFAALVGFIAPTGKYRKFVSLVMGFILLVMLLQPIRHFTGGDIPVNQWFAGILPEAADTSTTYHTWRDTHLAAAFEAQLSIQIEGLLARNNITVHGASFTYSQDFGHITSVRVGVSRQEEPRRVPFIRIEPVQINRDTPQEDPLVNEVKNLISGFYNLPDTHIYVEIVGT